jgi:hypothetical protein
MEGRFLVFTHLTNTITVLLNFRTISLTKMRPLSALPLSALTQTANLAVLYGAAGVLRGGPLTALAVV